MKLASREPVNLRKSQYSSRLIPAPNTIISRSVPRKGTGADTHRDGNIYYSNNITNEYELSALNNIITQTGKTSNELQFTSNDFSRQNLIAQVNVNSPKLNTDRLSYSMTPNRSFNKSVQKYLPPKTKQNLNKKTLVLDLDETLVHSSFKPFSQPSDIILKIEFENKIHEIQVLVRPGVEEFLERMSKHYELVIFTASLSKYAEPLVDRIDSKRLCFYRLFREHCTVINKSFVKDLRLLDRDLKDNNPFSYALNVENGFPIKNWFDDKKDRELFNISPILEFLAYVPDVRDFIKRMTDNNDISYPKAVSILNSYKLNKENLNKSNENGVNPIVKSSNTPTIKNIKDYSIKLIKDERIEYNNLNSSYNIKKIPTNNSQVIQNENNNLIPKYSSNLVSQKEKFHITQDVSNLNTNRLVGNQNQNQNNGYDKNNNKKESDKQNINIKIINNHINNYIVNPNEKKLKQINTFRSSNNNPQSNNNLEKSQNNMNIINRSNNNIEALKNNQQGQAKGLNLKSLNINLEPANSNEIRTNLLKNSQVAKPVLNKSINSNLVNQNVKYSSLIENKNSYYNSNNYQYSNNTNVARPSSAVIIKAKHSRDQSLNSNKNENIYSAMNRTPSTKNMINIKSGGNNKSINYLSQYDSLLNSRDTPKRTGTEQIIQNRISQGSKSVRSTSHNERMRFNYNAETNQYKPGRYDYDDSVISRGYYFSSRASDLKNRYISNPIQPGNNYSTAALSVQRSNNQIKIK